MSRAKLDGEAIRLMLKEAKERHLAEVSPLHDQIDAMEQKIRDANERLVCERRRIESMCSHRWVRGHFGWNCETCRATRPASPTRKGKR